MRGWLDGCVEEQLETRSLLTYTDPKLLCLFHLSKRFARLVVRHTFIAVVVVCMSTLLLIACDGPSKDGDVTRVNSRPVVPVPQVNVDAALNVDLENDIHVEKPVLQWAKPGLAPLFISDGADRGRGVGDQIVALIEKLMPQYNHVSLNLNYPRLLEELRKGSNVCAILHYTPEREKFMAYSQSAIITPSYQLYVSAKALERFKEQTGWLGGPTSFDDIMAKSRGLKFAITPGQSYGSERDEILKRHADKAEIIRSFANQETLVKRLAVNRIDMILGFPWVINYIVDKLAMGTDLIKVPLNDVLQYEASFIACANTPWGRTAIASINSISPPVHDLAKDLLPRWLSENESQSYYDVYQKYYHEDKLLP